MRKRLVNGLEGGGYVQEILSCNVASCLFKAYSSISSGHIDAAFSCIEDAVTELTTIMSSEFEDDDHPSERAEYERLKAMFAGEETS